MQHTTHNQSQKLIAFLSTILLLVFAFFVIAMTMKIGQNLAAIFDASPVDAAPGEATAAPVVTGTPSAGLTPAAPTPTPGMPTSTPLPVETPVVVDTPEVVNTPLPTPEVLFPHLIAGDSGVNVRSGPGTDYDKIGLLLPGDEVLIEGYSGDWWAVTLNGERGWVYQAIVTAFSTNGVPELAAPPLPTPEIPVWAIDEGHWIDVDLSDQRLTAFEAQTPVKSYLVSTGLPQTPTPVGQFRIWIKLPLDDMAGPGCFIKDVPWVMYFFNGYGLHGVTWHANFWHPMSHGCVNQPNDMAEWLFNFAEVGTLVNVHE
ncbi:MAG: hypothetical protein E4H27_07475 [Anaerolineales bacterium]|nr:MAG: hypothetical protein E4H27_07475 [Anaerolineales bacterium]